MENNEQQPTQEHQLTKKERKDLKRQQKLVDREQGKRQKQTRRILFWVTIIILLVAGVFWLASLRKSEPINDNYHPAQDWIKGNKEAKVSIVEYSDFQCPACKIYASITKQLFEEFGDNLSITYRHFPLRSVHKNANIAAQAAEAAGIQGKFWEMHDVLFEKQEDWSQEANPIDKFIEYATGLGINKEQFRSDISSDVVKRKVDESYQAGLALKLNSTPTFFLNGEKIQNPANYDQFKSLVQYIIDK